MTGAVAAQCLIDLEAIPAFLAENDPGVRDLVESRGLAVLTAGLVGAREKIGRISSPDQCIGVLNDYLKTLRRGHLMISAPARGVGTAAPRPLLHSPSLTELTGQTLLLAVPSFAGEYRRTLAVLLRDGHDVLAKHPNWIIDVRGNGGGQDATYFPLLPWLLSHEVAEDDVEILVTPANIEALAAVFENWPTDDEMTRRLFEKLLASMRMAEPGSWVLLSQGTFQAAACNQVNVQDLPRPARVAVMIDNFCASSCEQFLLTVRQSHLVKLLGRPTFGALDYSNLLPYRLPSGERVLWYATSRSRRLPHFPIDPCGVVPDIYLPEPSDELAKVQELDRVRCWLEGGALNPHV